VTGVKNGRGDSRAQETRPADADDLKGATESIHAHAFAKNGKPHNPKGEPPHAPPGGQLAPGKSSQPERCVPERRTTRRVRLLGDKKPHKTPLVRVRQKGLRNKKGKTTARRSAPHSNRREPHNPKGASLSAPLGSGRERGGATRPGGCVTPPSRQCDACVRRSRTTRRVRRSGGARRVACTRKNLRSPKGATSYTAHQQGCKPPRAAPHRTATSASRTTRRVRRPVCLSVLGSPTTRRVRRSSDNWGGPPEGMPHNPEGASLPPIDGVARAPARHPQPGRWVTPDAFWRGARATGSRNTLRVSHSIPTT